MLNICCRIAPEEVCACTSVTSRKGDFGCAGIWNAGDTTIRCDAIKLDEGSVIVYDVIGTTEHSEMINNNSQAIMHCE